MVMIPHHTDYMYMHQRQEKRDIQQVTTTQKREK